MWHGKEDVQQLHRLSPLSRSQREHDVVRRDDAVLHRARCAVGVGDATKVMTVGTSDPDLWKMFDVKPVIGRFFGAEDNVPETPTQRHRALVLVLADAVRRTTRRASVRRSTSARSQYTVIGVAPEGFNGFATDAGDRASLPIAAIARRHGTRHEAVVSRRTT